MDSASAAGSTIDEDQYRKDVLLLPSKEAEASLEQKLVETARTLGLEISEIDLAAAGHLVSSIVSSGCSTDCISVCDDPTIASDAPQLDQIASSLSQITVASDQVNDGSVRSITSLSTRPTSYSSSEGRLVYGHDSAAIPTRSTSLVNIASSSKNKASRRSSLKNAIGKINFRKRRNLSTGFLSPAAHVGVVQEKQGEVDRVLVSRLEQGTVQDESDDSRNANQLNPDRDNGLVKVQVPVFDHESLQRSLEDPELSAIHQQHQLERDRHLAFEAAALDSLRRRQHTVIAAKLSQSKRLEDEKRGRNALEVSRLEERQLVAEIEQQREFERAKMNSRTRIKHMEGYFSNLNSPPSPRSTSDAESDSVSVRRFTSKHKALLAQEYHDYESMDRLHEAKIKVLRERQELKLQEAIAKMDRQLDDLKAKHEEELSRLHSRHREERSSLLQSLHVRRAKLRHRWNLEEAILSNRLQTMSGQSYGPLPPLSFSNPRGDGSRDSAICMTETSDHSVGASMP